MSVKYGLLGILARQPKHGYELKRTFERITGGFWRLNYGQIYQTLDRLEGDGLVNHTVEHDVSAPDRKVYDITAAGRSALARWLDNPEPRPRPLRDELFIRLAVMAGEELEPVLELLARHRTLYLAKMAELTRAKGRSKRGGDGRDGLVEELLLDAALFHTEADLRWLEHCEAKLRTRGRARPN